MSTTRTQDTSGLDVAELVRRAAAGESWAWERLIDQYSRLIWAITRDFKLVESDAADVAQVTWLRLLENIHKIENPDRVGSWLASTARNECLRCLANRKRVVLAEDEDTLQGGASAEPEIDAGLLLAERSEMVREAVARLPQRWQQMLDMLMADPPASYAEISDQLGLPIGSIGPTRSRCLARLRALIHSSLFTDLSVEVRLGGIPATGRPNSVQPSGNTFSNCPVTAKSTNVDEIRGRTERRPSRRRLGSLSETAFSGQCTG